MTATTAQTMKTSAAIIARATIISPTEKRTGEHRSASTRFTASAAELTAFMTARFERSAKNAATSAAATASQIMRLFIMPSAPFSPDDTTETTD